MRYSAAVALLIALGTPGSVQAQATTDSSSRSVTELLSRPEVARYLEYFTGPARNRMSQWLNRGTSYRDLIRSKLDREGLPSEFESLPIIESGFSNNAVSRAGAAGMWQFMPETAREYGLRVDRWVDERRDPYRATGAAVRHIRDLNNTFGGPLLAAAAYNSGTGRVTRSLARLNKTPGDSTTTDDDFFSLAARRMLPEETRNYVPQLLAASAIAKDPASYGFDVDSTAPVPIPDSVRVDRMVSLAAADRALGLDHLTMANLNPQFIRGVTPPGGSWIRVPAGFGDSLLSRLAALPAVALARFESRAPKLGPLIRVRRGETLLAIAREHQVDESELRRVNALPKWYKLRPGQALRLPGA